MADGEIRITTELDTSGVKAGANDIKAAMKDAAKSIGGYNQEAVKFVNEFAEGLEKAKGAENEMLSALKEAEAEVKSLEGAGKFFGDDEYDQAVIKLQRIRDEINLYKKDILTPTPASPTADSGDAGNVKQIGENADISNQKVANLVARLRELKARQAELQAAGVGLGHTEFDRNTQEISRVEAELSKYRQSLTATGNETKKLDSHTRKSNSAFSGFGEKLKSAGASMKKGITTLLKYAIGIRTLWTLFNKLRAAIKQGLGNLAQYDAETNASLSALKSSLTQLKNSLATAFAPILQSVVPILVTLINYLIQAANAVAMFMAAITGKGKMAKAVAVQENYAAAVGGTGAAAKEAKKYLSGLDEIQTFTSDNGGGGGGGGGGVDPSSMFETVEVEGPIADFAKQLKELFEAQDWKGLGTLLGEKINEGIESIPWEDIGSAVGSGINGAVQTAYWLLDTTKFDELGDGVAQLLNGAMENIDFEYVGRLLSEGFTSALDFFGGLLGSLDWEQVGTSIHDFFVGLFDNTQEWVADIDWAQVARDVFQKLKEFLTGLDFADIAQSFFKLLGSALAAAVTFVYEFVKQAVESIKEYFLGFIEDENGDGKFGAGEIINGILEGLLEGIKGIGQWIKDNIFDPFIEGFKAAFGISSPSTVMKEQGQFIMQGLFDGISSLISKVVGVFTTIKDKIVSAWTTVKTKTAEIWNRIGSWISEKWLKFKTVATSRFTDTKNAITGAWTTVKTKTAETWNYIGSWISAKWSTIKSTASTTWNNIKSTASTTWDSVKSTTISKWNTIKSSLSAAWNSIKTTATNVFSGLKTTVVNIWNGIKNAITGVINGISGVVSGLTSGIRSSINSVIGRLNGISIRVPAWVPFYGGRYFGFSIPYLASGAVIPPNAPFTAVLGDQRHGTNIETPESLLRQVIREESGKATYQFIAQINRKTLFDQMIEEAKMRQIMTGRDPFALAKG